MKRAINREREATARKGERKGTGIGAPARETRNGQRFIPQSADPDKRGQIGLTRNGRKLSARGAAQTVGENSNARFAQPELGGCPVLNLVERSVKLLQVYGEGLRVIAGDAALRPSHGRREEKAAMLGQLQRVELRIAECAIHVRIEQTAHKGRSL